MPTLSAGSNVTLTLTDYQVIAVNPQGGEVRVEAVSGLGIPAGNIAYIASQQTFGPYTAGQVKLTATARDCYYEVTDGTRNAGLYVGTTNAKPLFLGTNNAAQATLDTSGNLGLGVTPSAWDSPYRALEVSNLSLAGNSSGPTSWFANNVYVKAGTGSTYKATGPAGAYLQYQNQHQWYTAPSGTAGAAISFTQAMTLDANSNLLVDTTSSVDHNFKVQVNAPASGLCGIGVNNTTGYGVYLTYDKTGRYGGDAAAVRNIANSPLVFETNNTERVRIDSSGNLLVGTNSGGARLTVVGPNGSYASSINAGVTSGVYYLMNILAAGTFVGSITSNGSTTSYNTTSDYRLKEDVQPMTGALAKVTQLKPCTYKWKADGSDGQGFIAHELAEVCPQAVTGEKDAVDEDGKPIYQGIDTSFLVVTLTAAIKELKAEFDAYKAAHP